jgi:hypothetical protein
MDIFELTHKTMGNNPGGAKIPISVVGRNGQEWSIEEASQLIINNRAKFLYQGREVTDLDMLPEHHPDGT